MAIPAIGYPQLAPSEQQALRDQLDAEIGGLPAGLRRPARELYDRLAPQQWPVEWHLPWWLGREFALRESAVQALSLCNLLGLGYARLQDAILDERASQAERRRQRRLAAILYTQATRRLEGLFAVQAEFWEWRDEVIGQWRRSLSEGEQARPRRFAEWTEDDFLLLAWRGAPVKITAFGACLLAGRSAAVSALGAALDDMLAAQVLMDQFDDWQADLEAGRTNAFVAFVTDLAQVAENRDAIRRQVMQELLLGEAGGGYVDLARRRLQFARRNAELVPVAGLASYLGCLEVEMTASHRALRAEMQKWLQDAATALLPELLSR